MIELRGVYFDGKSSRVHRATLQCTGGFVTIQGEDEPLSRRVQLSQCRFDPPLGKTARSVRLPGDAVFETPDCDALTAIEKSAGKNRVMRLVHGIEARWKAVLLSLAGIIIFVWLFHTYAIPLLARRIAFALPPYVTEEVSRQTMDILDSHFLKPSELSSKKTEGIRNAFRLLLRDLGPDNFTYRLEFRKSPVIGPNAFALPSGTIVMTDELVNLSEDERELDGILLHEIAHVRERHAMRTLIQNAGIFLVITALTGDLSAISSSAASLPMLLAHSDYSRNFEREADRFAAIHLVQKGLPVKPLQDILRRIGKNRPTYPGESLFSSHPAMEERLEYLEELGKRQQR